MAGSPIWKVYTADNKYVASAKLPEYGAMIIAGIGIMGTTLRYDHKKVVWTDGVDGEASDSYDHVAATAYKRIS